MASPGAHPCIIRFGPFEVDSFNLELRKRGSIVKLPRQQFAVLLMLTEQAGQIVSRDEIHRRIWGPDTFVDFERGINFSINQIRAALGDNAENPSYIETIPRRGYRFIARIENVEPPKEASSVLEASVSINHSANASGAEKQVSSSSDHVDPPPPVDPARFLSRKKLLIGCLAVVMAVGVALVFSRAWHLGAPSANTNASARIRTFPLMSFQGIIRGIALSPDGRQIAFVWNGPNLGRFELYVQLIGGDRPLQITHSQDRMVSDIDWSPDGRLLALGRCGDEDRGALYTISPLGGPEQKLTDVVCWRGDTKGTWTPDGRSLVFSDACTPGGSLGIVEFVLATGHKRCVVAPDSSRPNMLESAVSPDGNTVAYVRESTAWVRDIYTVSLTNGVTHRLTFEANRIQGLIWDRDGQNIVFLSTRGGTNGGDVWKIAANGGPIEPEPTDNYRFTESRDGRRGASPDIKMAGTIWRALLAGPGGKLLSQRKIIDSSTIDLAPELSQDGKQIVYMSALSGAINTWRSEADGSNPLQLTSFGGESNGMPRWSPDRKWIVFDRRPHDHAQIYVIDSEGRNMRLVASGAFDNNVPNWSRDGKSIYFSSNRTGRWEMWKHDLGTGVEAEITQHGGFSAAESYDGRYLYYAKSYSSGIWRVPTNGGEEQRITAQPEPWYWAYWDVTDAGLYFYDIAALPRPAFKYYDFKTREMRTVLQPEGVVDDHEYGMSVSRDGRTVVYAQKVVTSTIVIAENLQ